MKLLPLNDVAEELGIGRRTLETWIARGEIVAINVSRNPASKKPRLRIRQDELERFLQSRAVNQSPSPKRRARRKPAEQIPRYV